MSARTEKLLERLLVEVEALKKSVEKLQEDQENLVNRFDGEQEKVMRLQRAADKLVTQTRKLVSGIEALISSS